MGRLINLFSALQSIGITPYFAGREIGESFELERQELIDNFMLEEPLAAETEDKIKVSLQNNGWKYNGRVIVKPLLRKIN